jgi:hypothetical protein
VLLYIYMVLYSVPLDHLENPAAAGVSRPGVSRTLVPRTTETIVKLGTHGILSLVLALKMAARLCSCAYLWSLALQSADFMEIGRRCADAWVSSFF